MTTDPIAAAIDYIRRITPQNDPWTGQDVADGTSGGEPVEADYAIATILNAVVSGQLINRHSRDEMLAQVRRGEGFATAGAEVRWIADSEAGVYDTDAQASLDEMLAEARLEGWRAAQDAAAHACDWGDIYGDNAVRAIRALPEPKEASHDN